MCREYKKTTEDFKKEVQEKYVDEYIVLGKYINARTKILVRHNCDNCNNNEYEIIPDSLLRGRSCPVCSGRVAKLGINTIYDTDRWMCDLGVSEEDAKKYTHGSHKIIIVTCPYCCKKKNIRIKDMYSHKSIACSCSDGKSYPEKFISNLLDQVAVDYKIEYNPEWSNNRRYDFYIPSLNCIIETHGKQHYDGGFKHLGGKSLKEEQENDKYKKDIALQNGIKNYIELDCRESNLEWIKNSILESKLNNLFNLSIINWEKCSKVANGNKVKEVCKYWNNKREDETTTDLGIVFKLSISTIIDYLKRGTKLGLCEYNPQKEFDKKYLKAAKIAKNKNGKKVMIFKDNKSLGVFDSCVELEKQSEELFGIKLLRANIACVCTGRRQHHKGYTFRYVEDNI